MKTISPLTNNMTFKNQWATTYKSSIEFIYINPYCYSLFFKCITNYLLRRSSFGEIVTYLFFKCINNKKLLPLNSYHATLLQFQLQRFKLFFVIKNRGLIVKLIWRQSYDQTSDTKTRSCSNTYDDMGWTGFSQCTRI